MIEDFVSSFINEARELLTQLEADLLLLEKSPGDREITGNIFRVMHNIKGAARMYGFNDIQDLAHVYENIFDRIRSGNLKVTRELIDDTLRGKDILLSMLEKRDLSQEKQLFIDSLMTRFGNSQEQIEIVDNPVSAGPKSFCILFGPDKAVFERGLNPEKTLNELLVKGRSIVKVHELEGTWQEQMKSKVCHTVWEIYMTAVDLPEIEEVFMFYEDVECRVFPLSDSCTDLHPDLESFFKRHYPDLDSPAETLQKCFLDLAPCPDQQEQPVCSEPKTEFREETVTDPRSVKESSIQVSSQKLDELMNLVSELVIITASLETRASAFGDVFMDNRLEDLEKLTKKFRTNALDLRLVPVGNLLKKFNREVRDLSGTLGKSVKLILDGQETEIDKSILRSIESPLMHILRNSIDHGIESPEERQRNGKSPEGRIKISAFYAGANVVIQVHDDGRGMDLEKIRKQAEKQALISPDQQITERDLIRLIMEPGFTTSEKVSMVSGRGVGMDVVRMELNAIGGSIEIETEKNLGTSITLKLPATLSIIDTLMLEVKGSTILVPLAEVEYCYKESRQAIYFRNSHYIHYKNSLVPYISLRQKFNAPPSGNEDEMVIIIGKYDKKYAIIADQILGEQQAVIKPLGELFCNQPYYSGGSIMADGNLALVLDTNQLFNQTFSN